MTRMLNLKDLYPDRDPDDLPAIEVQCTCPGCARGHTAWYCSKTADPFEDHGWRVGLTHTAYASLWPITPLDRPDGLEASDLTDIYVGVHLSSEGRLTLAGLCPACVEAGTYQPWLPPRGTES